MAPAQTDAVRRALGASTASRSTRRRRRRGLHVERAGNDDGVYRGAFKLGERQSLDRHTFGGDDRSTVKADGMPSVAAPTLLFHERGRRPEDRERTGEVKHPSP
jgi:hypothetical protein